MLESFSKLYTAENVNISPCKGFSHNYFRGHLTLTRNLSLSLDESTTMEINKMIDFNCTHRQTHSIQAATKDLHADNRHV